MASSVRRSDDRSIASLTSSTTASPASSENEATVRGGTSRAQRLDEGVEAEVLAVAVDDAARLEVDEHLAALVAGRPADDEVDLAPAA